MNPFDVKRKLYEEMGQAAQSGGVADLRSRYGKRPPPEPIPEALPELDDAELEPLLSITIAQKPGKAQLEPEPDEDDTTALPE